MVSVNADSHGEKYCMLLKVVYVFQLRPLALVDHISLL